jgi:hypothetical protein
LLLRNRLRGRVLLVTKIKDSFKLAQVKVNTKTPTMELRMSHMCVSDAFSSQTLLTSHPLFILGLPISFAVN